MANYLPNEVASTIYDIDWKKLYLDGKRVIIFDLDNTLISYRELTPTSKLVELGKELILMGFTTYVLTNNHYSRIEKFIKEFPATDYGIHMNKPFIKNITAYLKEKNHPIDQNIIMVGDQLVTDIACANKLGVYSILIKSLDRSSEHFYTKINRLRDKRIVKSISKVDYKLALRIEEVVNKGAKKWLNASDVE